MGLTPLLNFKLNRNFEVDTKSRISLPLSLRRVFVARRRMEVYGIAQVMDR